MLLVYAADTDCLKSEEAFARLYRSVQPCRREKIDRLRFPKDKRLSLGAGVLLKMALNDAGCDYARAQFLTDENGRPFLKNSALQFSLSHSHDRVMCAVADHAVGCDLEKVGAFDEKLARRFFCPEETRQILAQTNDEAKQDAFYRLWTLKESFSKAVGKGLLLPLDSFCVTLGEPPELRQNVSKEAFFLHEFAPQRGFRQSICVLNEQNCCIFEKSLL